jgi:hypothetical protein
MTGYSIQKTESDHNDNTSICQFSVQSQKNLFNNLFPYVEFQLRRNGEKIQKFRP